MRDSKLIVHKRTKGKDGSYAGHRPHSNPVPDGFIPEQHHFLGFNVI